MKKMISILVATLMLLTSVSVFASATRPEAIALDVTTKANITNTKIDTTGVEVKLVDGNTAVRNTSGGNWDTMFDGKGMVGGFYSNNEGTVTKLIVDGSNYKASSTVYKVKGTERWYVQNDTDTPALEIKLTAPATFNTVKWTELRKEIKKYTFTFYNGEEKVGEYSGTFDSEDTNTNLFLRTVYLDGDVTADKIIFSIDEVFGTKIVSVTEMEFWKLDAEATVSVADGGEASHTSFGGINTIFDGVSTNATANRWATPAEDDLPTITVKFFNDVTLNTIRWSEVRKNIKTFTVTCYKDGVAILTKDGDLTDEVGGTSAYEREFELGQSVTVDEIKFEVKTLNSSNATSIAEMEFYNNLGENAPTATDAEGTAIASTSGYDLEYAFDGKHNGDGSTGKNRFLFVPFDETTSENIYTLPITISFDLGSNKTFNYAQLAELRCALGTIDVEVSTNGSVYNKVGTMPALGYKGSTSYEAIHSVSFDAVTARYVKFIINEMADLATLQADGSSSKGITINEISLFNYPELSDGKEAMIYPVIARGIERTELPDLRNVGTNVTISNTSGAAKSYILVGALYAEDGTLSDSIYSTVTVEAGKTRTFSIPVKAEGKTVRFFAWETTLAPLTGAVSVSK